MNLKPHYLMNIKYKYYIQIFLFAVSIFISILLTNLARADSNCPAPVFYVEAIDVSVEADTSQKARRIAGDLGVKKAWEVLKNRLLLTDQSDDGAVKVSKLHDLIDHTRIAQETVLPSRYIGQLDYCFDRAKTRQFFQDHSFRHAELPSGKMLVLPVLNIGTAPRLWRRPNFWAEAWAVNLQNRDGLVDLQLASSLSVERSVAVEPVIRGERDVIATAAGLEKAEHVIITVLTPSLEGDNARLDVRADLYDRHGNFETTIYSLDRVELPIPQLPTTLGSLVENMTNGIENIWRTANVINTQDRGFLLLRVPASSIKQWSDRIRILNNLAPVERLTVVQVSSTGGIVRLELAGSLTSLNHALEVHAFTLEQSGSGDVPAVFVPITN